MKISTTSLQGLTVGLSLALFAVFGFVANSAFAANDDADEPIVGTADISESKALQIADKAYTGSGKFTDIELEMEHGVLVYAVEYIEGNGNEVDVKLNADTGAIVVIESEETEDPSDDDDDAEEDDMDDTAKMQMLINLLNQLLVLLRAQQ